MPTKVFEPVNLKYNMIPRPLAWNLYNSINKRRHVHVFGMVSTSLKKKKFKLGKVFIITLLSFRLF